MAGIILVVVGCSQPFSVDPLFLLLNFVYESQDMIGFEKLNFDERYRKKAGHAGMQAVMIAALTSMMLPFINTSIKR